MHKSKKAQPCTQAASVISRLYETVDERKYSKINALEAREFRWVRLIGALVNRAQGTPFRTRNSNIPGWWDKSNITFGSK